MIIRALWKLLYIDFCVSLTLRVWIGYRSKEVDDIFLYCSVIYKLFVRVLVVELSTYCIIIIISVLSTALICGFFIYALNPPDNICFAAKDAPEIVSEIQFHLR